MYNIPMHVQSYIVHAYIVHVQSYMYMHTFYMYNHACIMYMIPGAYEPPEGGRSVQHYTISS